MARYITSLLAISLALAVTASAQVYPKLGAVVFKNDTTMSITPSKPWFLQDTARVSGIIIPHLTTSYDLGADSLRWRYVFARHLYADSISSTDNLSIDADTLKIPGVVLWNTTALSSSVRSSILSIGSYDIDHNTEIINLYSGANGFTATAPYTNHMIGIVGRGLITGSNTQDWTNTAFGLVGTEGAVRTTLGATGTLTSAVSLLSRGEFNANMAITNYKGLFVQGISSAAGGRYPDNAYGIFVEDVDSGRTSNYAIYTESGNVHFGDDVDVDGGLAVNGDSLTSTAHKFVMFGENVDTLYIGIPDRQWQSYIVPGTAQVFKQKTAGSNLTSAWSAIWDDQIDLMWQSGDSARWILRLQPGGTSSDRDLALLSRNDDGSAKSTVFQIDRTTGAMDYNLAMNVDGAFTATSSMVVGSAFTGENIIGSSGTTPLSIHRRNGSLGAGVLFDFDLGLAGPVTYATVGASIQGNVAGIHSGAMTLRTARAGVSTTAISIDSSQRVRIESGSALVAGSTTGRLQVKASNADANIFEGYRSSSATLNSKIDTNGTGQFNSLRINAVGSLIDSAVVVADTLKFYIGGVAYNAVKSESSLAWLWFILLGVGVYEMRRRFA